MKPAVDKLALLKREIEIERELLRRHRENRLARMFPDAGRLSRDLYPKHIDFINKGADNRVRILMGGNRTGKTELGAYEVTCHLTGLYPHWWQGRRFEKNVRVWVAGESSKVVKETLQVKFFGNIGQPGTGLIPKDCIIRTTNKAGVPDAIETGLIKHALGGNSELTFKTFEQGRESFQGAEIEIAWGDEEGPLPIHTEMLMRTMTTDGLIIWTFTPLKGLTELILHFLPDGSIDSKPVGATLTNITWDDAPHLSPAVREEMINQFPIHEREARRAGVPMLGSGAIYPVAESVFVIDPFPLQQYWRHCFALDVGWNRTAALWLAGNPDTDEWFVYSEHYQGEQKPVEHAEAIKGRGAWIPGVIDPAARGRSQADGISILSQYQDAGLTLSIANNTVEAGIFKVWTMLSTGKLKVFNNCTNFLKEFRLYRRDDKGKPVKQNDHLQDCCRYAIMSGLQRAETIMTSGHADYHDYDRSRGRVNSERYGFGAY